MTIYRLTLRIGPIRSFGTEPTTRAHQYYFTGDPSKAQVIHLLKKDTLTALVFQDDYQFELYERLAELTKQHGLPSLMQMSHGTAAQTWEEDAQIVGSATLEEVEVHEVA